MNDNLITGDAAWEIIESYAKSNYPKSLKDYTFYYRMWEDSPMEEVTLNWALTRSYKPSKHQQSDDPAYEYVELCVSRSKPDKYGYRAPIFMWNSDKWYQNRLVLERVIDFNI